MLLTAGRGVFPGQLVRPDEDAVARLAPEVRDAVDGPVVLAVGSVEGDPDPDARGELGLADEGDGTGGVGEPQTDPVADREGFGARGRRGLPGAGNRV